MDAFQALADPSRRQILQLLSQDSLSINSIAENFSMSRPAVSKHIKILENGGLLTIYSIGRERYCVLRQEGFKELREWMEFFDGFWLEKLTKLEVLLQERSSK